MAIDEKPKSLKTVKKIDTFTEKQDRAIRDDKDFKLGEIFKG